MPSSIGGRSSVPGYGAADSTRQKFTSKERDSESGLDYFLARYYSSAQGRFTSVDPAMSSARPAMPQSWNRYAYCINNPLVYVDPLGLDWRSNDNDGSLRWYKEGEDTTGTTAYTRTSYKINDTQEVHLNPYGPGSGAPDVYRYLSSHEANSDYYKNGWDIRDIVTDRGPLASGAVETDWNATFAIGGMLNAGRVGLGAAIDSLAGSFGRGAAEGGGTTLFRAVTKGELNDILSTGAYRTGGTSIEGKYFFESADDAAGFARNMFNSFSHEGPYTITSTNVSNSVIQNSSKLFIRGEGAAVVVPKGQLPLGPVKVWNYSPWSPR